MIMFVLCFLVFTALCSTEDHPHRVKSLPGAPTEPSFSMYAGYLNVSAKGAQYNVFYILCEAIRADPLEAPLVVWFNGGPGGSSLIGFFLEHGPYIIEPGTDNLRYNDFSWNQYANVLYIESPGGVGFSKTNAPYYTTPNDLATADLKMRTLEEFMTRVHPRYANRDFFITGESYAGMYIPHLARAILSNRNFSNENFRGIAIGNPLMDPYSSLYSIALQMFSMGMLPQTYQERLFELWQQMQDSKYNEIMSLKLELEYTFNDLMEAIYKSALYNVRAVCEEDQNTENWHIAPPKVDGECTIGTAASHYLNRYDVQKSLNVIDGANKTIAWTAINENLNGAYLRTYDALYLYRKIFKLAKANFRILFFSGDLDLACPASHVARAAAKIAKKFDLRVVSQSHIFWHYLGDLGGALTSYKSNRDNNMTMDVLTVRGAGHLVPMSHPSRSFQIINNFLSSTESPIDYSQKIRRRPFFKK